MMGLLLHCRYTSQLRQSCILNCRQETMRTLFANLVTWAAPLIGPATTRLLCTFLVVKLLDGTEHLITQRLLSASTTPPPALFGLGTRQRVLQIFVKEDAVGLLLVPAGFGPKTWEPCSLDSLLPSATGAPSGSVDENAVGIVFGADLNANLRLGAISERTFCN